MFQNAYKTYNVNCQVECQQNVKIPNLQMSNIYYIRKLKNVMFTDKTDFLNINRLLAVDNIFRFTKS